MRIDFLGLQAFVAIAERGSFLRAAAHLNLSQTALSHRMKKFEDDLGLMLLIRTTRSVTLTPAGLELLPKARSVLDDLASHFDHLREQADGRHARLSIGCLPTIAAQHLPHILTEFQTAHPDVAVKVYDNSAMEIAALVENGAAEFGITTTSANVWDLEIKPLVKEPFVLLCPKDHSFARQKSMSWAQLGAAPLIRISPQTGNRVLIDDALGRRRDQLNWHYEVQHIQTAVSMVAEKIALTIVPKLAVGLSSPAGVQAVGLHHPSVTRTLGILSKRGLPLSPTAEAMIEIVRQHMRRMR